MRPVRKAKDDRRASILRLLAALLSAFLAGMAVRGLISGDPPRPASTVTPGPSGAANRPGPGPARFEDGIPAGFAQSEEGARAAAASYVLTGERLLELPPTRVASAIRQMAASGSADAQAADAEEQLRQLRDVLDDGTGPVRYVQAVLATRLEAYSAERARVSVWNVGVLSRIGAAQPQAGWTTSTFELVWERGDWRIWSETIAPGPAPDLNAGAAPATSAELEQALSGFLPWRWGS